MSGRSATVLLADDDDQFVRCLTAELAKRGYRATGASNAEDLARCLSTSEPEWAVVEPHLPGTNWYSVVHDRGLRGVRWAAVTSFPSGALSREVWAVCEKPVLSKPVKVDAILRLLNDERCLPLAESPSSHPSLARVEWEHINDVVASCKGKICEAARLLGLPRQTLYRKLRRHPPIW
jgi:two-component system response regulator RegA